MSRTTSRPLSLLRAAACAAFFLCAACAPEAAKEPPSVSFLGISPDMSLREVSHTLKHRGYLSSGLDNDGTLQQRTFVARNRAATFDTIGVIADASGGGILGLYFSGDARERILSVAKQQFDLEALNPVRDMPQALAASGAYRPRRATVFKEQFRLALFRVPGIPPIYGISIEPVAQAVRRRQAAGRNTGLNERALYEYIEVRLDDRGEYEFIEDDPPVAVMPRIFPATPPKHHDPTPDYYQRDILPPRAQPPAEPSNQDKQHAD